MRKKVLFIGGSSYSGSTMLDMMLSNTKKGFSVGEIYALFRPYRPHHFDPHCGCGDPKCAVWLKRRETGEETLYQSIFEEFEDIEYIVDSSKDPLWINDQLINLSKQGIDAYNLLIWKDPISFYASMIKRNSKRGIRAWINYHRLYSSLIDSWIPISYKDIAQDPTTSLKIICSKTGLSHHDEMHKYWKKQHHTLFGNDSAKIHLSDSTDEYKIEDTRKSAVISKDTSMHRSIYYRDNSNIVEESVKTKIKSNKLINQIVKTIPSGKITNENNIVYKKSELVTRMLILNIKILIGRLIGKYFRVF